MLPASDQLRYQIATIDEFCPLPLQPFAEEVCAFLAEFSLSLMADPSARNLPDVITLAWWCRKAQIQQLAATYRDSSCRIGRGVAFHITPSNMPVNFAFSWVFSLLAGNANIVRLPRRDFPQIPIILDHITSVLKAQKFSNVRTMNTFVAYGHELEITKAFSVFADARIIWGGDRTIETVRASAPLPAHAIDVGFPDRYSFSILGGNGVLNLDEQQMMRLAEGFFNDTYLADQGACSSPHLVIWLGSERETMGARERFWNAVQKEVARRYTLAPILAVEKLMQTCRDALEIENAVLLKCPDSRICRVQLKSLDPCIAERRCNGGYFYEYHAGELAELVPIVTRRYQTLTYFAVSPEELKSLLIDNRLTGIDRIVPVGEAMNIGVLWDGHDLIRILSRVCDVH